MNAQPQLMQLQDVVAGLPPTIFYYWTDSYAREHPAKIQRAIPAEKKDFYLALDATIFHPKSGGQPSDRGTIAGEDFRLQIKKSMQVGKHIVLWGRILEGTPKLGGVTEEIDWDWRYLMMRRHSAAHLFDHCLTKTIGSEVETTDSWLGDPCYAGYKGQAPTSPNLEKAASLENEFIHHGLEVKAETVSQSAMQTLATRAPNLRRLPELQEYRIVTIEGCTPIPCGGTHVKDAREIKGFRVVRVEQLPESFRVYFEAS